MQAFGPALCALLLVHAQGDDLANLGNLTDDQREAVVAGGGAAAWTMASGLAVAAACCCWAVLPAITLWVLGSCEMTTFRDAKFSIMGDYTMRDYTMRGRGEEAGGEIERGETVTKLMETQTQTDTAFFDISQAVPVVKGELAFFTLLPFVCGLAWLGLALALRGEPPAWLQGALVLALVLRSCHVEKRLVHKSIATLICEEITCCIGRLRKLFSSLIVKLGLAQESAAPVVSEDSADEDSAELPFIVTKLEVADAVTDGLAIATVFLLERADPVFHARLEAAWGAGPVGRLFAPLVLRVGLSGPMLLVQVGGAFSQLIAGSDRPELGAELAGLGAVSNKIKDRGEPKFVVSLPKTVVRGFLEGAGQLLFQSSAILAQGTGLLGEPALAASVALTSCTLLRQGVQLIRVRLFGHMDCTLNFISYHAVFWFVGAMMCCIVAGVAVRLGMSETCGGSLLYDLGSRRCVPAPLPTGN